MFDQLPPGDGPAPDAPIACPWCSTALPADVGERCPSCGASLREADRSEIPGVTRVDHEALLRSRAPVQRSRGLIGWLAGEYEAKEPAAVAGTLEPPDETVRREILRLELAALQAEVQARQAEAAAAAVDLSVAANAARAEVAHHAEPDPAAAETREG